MRHKNVKKTRQLTEHLNSLGIKKGTLLTLKESIENFENKTRKEKRREKRNTIEQIIYLYSFNKLIYAIKTYNIKGIVFLDVVYRSKIDHHVLRFLVNDNIIEMPHMKGMFKVLLKHFKF